jgi:hypothetical protein
MEEAKRTKVAEAEVDEDEKAKDEALAVKLITEILDGTQICQVPKFGSRTRKFMGFETYNEWRFDLRPLLPMNELFQQPDFYQRNPQVVNLLLQKLQHFQTWRDLDDHCPGIFTATPDNFVAFCALYQPHQRDILLQHSSQWIYKTIFDMPRENTNNLLLFFYKQGLIGGVYKKPYSNINIHMSNHHNQLFMTDDKNTNDNIKFELLRFLEWADQAEEINILSDSGESETGSDGGSDLDDVVEATPPPDDTDDDEVDSQ